MLSCSPIGPNVGPNVENAEPLCSRARMFSEAGVDRRLRPSPALPVEDDGGHVTDLARSIRDPNDARLLASREHESGDRARVVVAVTRAATKCVKRMLERFARLSDEANRSFHERLDSGEKTADLRVGGTEAKSNVPDVGRGRVMSSRLVEESDGIRVMAAFELEDGPRGGAVVEGRVGEHAAAGARSALGKFLCG
jgi:hypothetical protein